MARITSCSRFLEDQNHHGHHLHFYYIHPENEGRPDERDCESFRIVEETSKGCCEMKRGGGCLYVGMKARVASKWKDKAWAWDGSG